MTIPKFLEGKLVETQPTTIHSVFQSPIWWTVKPEYVDEVRAYLKLLGHRESHREEGDITHKTAGRIIFIAQGLSGWKKEELPIIAPSRLKGEAR